MWPPTALPCRGVLLDGCAQCRAALGVLCCTGGAGQVCQQLRPGGLLLHVQAGCQNGGRHVILQDGERRRHAWHVEGHLWQDGENVVVTEASLVPVLPPPVHRAIIVGIHPRIYVGLQARGQADVRPVPLPEVAGRVVQAPPASQAAQGVQAHRRRAPVLVSPKQALTSQERTK